jgi:glycosyltransferase involved in cell wall biosynthesis
MSKPPDIGVVIPCRNEGRLLLQAVDSVRAQRGGFRLGEIVVVDDRSDDRETIRILDELRVTRGVTVIPNEGPRGPGGARNTGANRVESPWLYFLDADDLALPGGLEALTRALREHREVSWCGGDFLLTTTGRVSDDPPVYRSGRKTSTAFEGYDFRRPLLLRRPTSAFIRGMLTWSGAFLVRQEAFASVGGYDEALLFSQDNHLHVRLARHHDFLFVPEAVLAHRIRGTSHTRSRRSPRVGMIRGFRSLLRDPAFRAYRTEIHRKLHLCHRQDRDYHRREGRAFRWLADWLWAKYYRRRSRRVSA